jgi:hypothetical protein
MFAFARAAQSRLNLAFLFAASIVALILLLAVAAGSIPQPVGLFLAGAALALSLAVARPQSAGATGDRVRDLVKAGVIALAVVFTNAGAAIVTNRVIQAGTAPKYIGWGVGTTAAAVTDTALVTESAPTTAGGRTTGTESRTTITNTNDNYAVGGTVTATSALAITEAGLFDALTAGAMLIRGVFTAINVAIGDSIAFTFGLKFVPA